MNTLAFHPMHGSFVCVTRTHNIDTYVSHPRPLVWAQSEDGKDIVYPVNSLAFHPSYGTFVSGGCDGVVNIWDGANKKRLHQYAPYPTSIAALAFSADGAQLAVASSYTFELGEQAQHPVDRVYVRTVDREVMPKPKPPPR